MAGLKALSFTFLTFACLNYLFQIRFECSFKVGYMLPTKVGLLSESWISMYVSHQLRLVKKVLSMEYPCYSSNSGKYVGIILPTYQENVN